MGYGEQTRNPHAQTEQDEHDNPIHCHHCGDYLGQAETLTPVDGIPFGGWWYCHPHAPESVQADLDQASRRDVERDAFNEVRR